MKLEDKLENTLGGNWAGLHGEVVTFDCYGFKTLDFVPEVIFDVGANVGTFTRHARSLFPDAQIVAVEPDESNCAHFMKFTDMRGVRLVQAALGKGEVFRATTAANGAGEVYMSAGLGYPKGKLASDPCMRPVAVATVTLDDVVCANWKPSLRAAIKIDCEGAENHIWNHPASMRVLRAMDYIAMEIHKYAADGAEQNEVNRVTDAALASFSKTHDCWREGVHFHARLKKDL